ncbi:uncharacterized protein LOC142578104 [Dermacentor variabilis]|uniref:uncharacterized protein LOC142578104 n=1 Tax=Dermacentor variabilis TaxID=34621 RepID=UPI003F5C2394
MDVYRNTKITSIRQTVPGGPLDNTRSDGHFLRKFEKECWRGVYKHDTKGVLFKYFAKGCCNFANYSVRGFDGLTSFETSRSIQDKMTKVKMLLKKLNMLSTHIVGWLAHDVTFNLAMERCGGAGNRLLKMRELTA